MNHTIESTIVNRAMDEMRRELRACPGFDVWLQVDNDNQHNIALTAHCVCVCEGKGEGQHRVHTTFSGCLAAAFGQRQQQQQQK